MSSSASGSWCSSALSLIHGAAGSDYHDSFKLSGHRQRRRAARCCSRPRRKASGDSDRIVIATSGGKSITDPAVQGAVESMLAEVAEAAARRRRSPRPFAAGAAAQISKDGKIAYATVTLRRAGERTCPIERDRSA